MQAAPRAPRQIHSRREPDLADDALPQHRAEMARQGLAGKVHQQPLAIVIHSNRLVMDWRTHDRLCSLADGLRPAHYGDRPTNQGQLDAIVVARRRRCDDRLRAVTDVTEMEV